MSQAATLRRARKQVLHELGNPKYAWCRVTRVVPKGDGGFYFGFAVDAHRRTLYFQKAPGDLARIWLGPWEIRGHRPEPGHLLFGEWEEDRRKPGCFRLKWQVSALDLFRFRRCLEERNTIFVRRPSSAVANAMIAAVLYGQTSEKLGELERKQLAHLCRLPLDYFL